MLPTSAHLRFAAAEPAAPAAPRVPVVLVVDDDADMRLLISDAIEEAEQHRGGDDLEVVELDSGEAAVEHLKRALAGGLAAPTLPSLIYMDVEMPGIGGLEAVRQIKANPRLRDIPIVVLSGLSDATAIGRASEYGANSYTVKPADADQLAKTLLSSTDYWLHVHQTPTKHAPQSACRR